MTPDKLKVKEARSFEAEIKHYKVWQGNKWVTVSLTDNLLASANELLEACKYGLEFAKKLVKQDDMFAKDYINVLEQAINHAEGKA